MLYVYICTIIYVVGRKKTLHTQILIVVGELMAPQALNVLLYDTVSFFFASGVDWTGNVNLKLQENE